MKKSILFLSFFALLNTILVAQTPTIIASSGNIITVSVDATLSDVEADAKVKNTSAKAKTFRWERTEICNTPKWVSTVCDVNTCWSPAVSSKTFNLAAGSEGILLLHIAPEKKKGAAVFKIKVTEVADTSNTTTVTYIFNSDCSVGTNDADAEVAAFYLSPNPANEFIKIAATDLVKYVEIYNLLGRKVRTFDYEEGKQYWVNDLNAGMYLVRLSNENNKPLKTIKLYKK
jgi:Secretion system C-terminal sorting domain